MGMPFNVSVDLLSWVKAEIDHSLKNVRENIAKFLAQSGDPDALRDCPEQLRQVRGALQMVGLDGVTRVCEAIEQALAKTAGRQNLTKTAASSIDRAVYAVNQFLDDLLKGEPNAPLKLFPSYREVSALQGRRDVAEKDLFFPDASIESPPHPAPVAVAAGELSAYLRTHRARFQRGMLAWLRNPADARGVREMQLAIDGLDRTARQLPAPRALWWAAVGMIEGVALSRQPEWIAAAKPLFSKIDRQIRDLAAGAAIGSEPLLREILYALATCPAAGPRIKDVRQLFKLDVHLADPATLGLMEYDLDRLQPMLQDMSSRLEAAKNIWIQYTAGEKQALARFREITATLKTKADELGNQHLVCLFEVIALVTNRLPDPYSPQQQLMTVEMAAAFLLIEHILETFTAPLPNLDQQVNVMSAWLLDAAKGKTRSGELPPGLRADLSQRIADMQLRAQVAKEICANLQIIERVLDTFARDPAKRDELPTLPPLLNQIHGALVMLNFRRADRLLVACAQLIGECAQAGHPEAVRDIDRIAEGLSSLGLFLDPMLRGRPPADPILENCLARFEQQDALSPASPARKPATAAPIAAPATAKDETARSETPAEAALASPPATAGQDADDGLLDIYLEEAEQVLADINRALPVCREHADDLDALTTIRRGFHTLKGSGRMVHLDELGEIAWELEQVLNHWLEQGKPATPALLDLISQAGAAFAGWVNQLKTRSLSAVAAGNIVALARELKAAAATEPAPTAAAPPEAPQSQATPDAAPPAPQLDHVIVGDVRLSPEIYGLYLNEARQHLATLDREFAAWRELRGAEVAHEFMRAVHTLTGISRTTGFTAVADLGATLEQWLPYAALAQRDDQRQVVKAAIAKLGEMVGSLALLQPPPAGAAEARQLQELLAESHATRTQIPMRVQDPTATVIREPAASVTATTLQAEGFALGKAIAAAKKDQRAIRDDLDPHLLPVFLEEAQQLLPLIGQDLREWKAHPDNYRLCHALQRSLHTLKGSARMAGAMRLGELTHRMESKVETALESETAAPTMLEALESEMDRLSADIERLHRAPPAAEAKTVNLPAVTAAAEPVPKLEPPLAGPAAMLRINADMLDHLVNESGEISIARSRLEGELRAFRQSLADLDDSVTRLRNQLHEVEIQADSQMQSRLSILDEQDHAFDPLEFDRYTRLQELTRMMAESLHDVNSIRQNLLKTIGEADAATIQQARINRDLQQELMRMRTVPFATLGERLYRTVRQTARELGKKVNLEIEGGQVELDRSVLERISAPLEHMLRNAVGHGLEPPAARAAAGKPEIGEIRIALRQEGNEIVIIVVDDGAGIDLGKLRRKAVERGLLQEHAAVSESELIGFIFAAGLSTADEITELAGRGVGMDVVRSEIAAVGGRVEVATRRGEGTTVTIFLPLTLAVTQAVLVRAGSDLYAIPAAMMEQVLKLKPETLAGHYERGEIETQGGRYPLRYLGQLLGQNASAAELHNYNSVLLLRSGIQRLALHADELVKNQEIVVKNIGPQLARVPGIAGATVLGDGRIVLIINPVLLAQRATHPRAESSTVVRTALDRILPPTVMVVDDSLTVRKITGKLLEREGYQVLTAKDGIDALEKIKDLLPDIMLVDIEMPRMDGFDLTKSIRNDRRTRDIPIIVISSRTAEKHRNHALRLGVNAFFGKPYQEAELLRQIESLLPRKDRPAAAPAMH